MLTILSPLVAVAFLMLPQYRVKLPTGFKWLALLALGFGSLSVWRGGPEAFFLLHAASLALLMMASSSAGPSVPGALRLGLIAAAMLSVVYAGLQAVGLDPFPHLYRGGGGLDLSAFSGNPAAAAALAGMGVICLWRGPRSTLPLRALAIGALLIHIVSLQGRSVPLTLFAAFLLSRRHISWPLRQKALFAGLLALALIAATAWLTLGSPGKSLSASARLARWQNTLLMIRENPLGIGPGGFADRYLSYYRRAALDPEVSEFSLITHPHNEALRVLAEWGLPCVLLLLLLGACLRLASSRQAHSQPEADAAMAREIFFFLGAEGMFHGTLLWAPSAWALAILAPSLMESRALHSPWPGTRWLLAILSAALLVLSGQGLMVRVVEGSAQKNSASDLFHACHSAFGTDAVCELSAERDLREGNPGRAKATLEELLERRPNSFSALRLLAAAFGELGERGAACGALLRYEKIFNYASRFSDRYRELCGSRPYEP